MSHLFHCNCFLRVLCVPRRRILQKSWFSGFMLLLTGNKKTFCTDVEPVDAAVGLGQVEETPRTRRRFHTNKRRLGSDNSSAFRFARSQGERPLSSSQCFFQTVCPSSFSGSELEGQIRDTQVPAQPSVKKMAVAYLRLQTTFLG